MIRDYFYLAYQSAKQRKLRSWLTMLGIFIGIAAVVALVSLSQGMQQAIAGQFVKLGSDKLIIQSAETGYGPPGTDVTNPLTSSDKKTVEKVKGVDLAVGRLIRSAKLEFKDEVKYDYLVSMPDGSSNLEWELVVEANDYQLLQGRLLKKEDKFKAVIGQAFNEDYFEQPIQLRDKIKIEAQLFEVVGILKKSGNPFHDSSLILPESSIREILKIGDEYDLIAVKVTKGEALSSVEERIKKELRKNRGVEEGKEDFTVETPAKIMQTLSTILFIVQGVLIGIAAISLLVGGIGIMNTMYTAVLERTKEIGLMKATGAKNNQVLFLFLIESGALGLVGGLIGIALGLGISKLVELVAYQIYGSFLIKASFSPFLLVGALLFSFLVGAFSGVFPARQAAKLKPVEALRG